MQSKRPRSVYVRIAAKDSPSKTITLYDTTIEEVSAAVKAMAEVRSKKAAK